MEAPGRPYGMEMDDSNSLSCKSVPGWDVCAYETQGNLKHHKRWLQARGEIHWEGSVAVNHFDGLTCLWPSKFSGLSPSHLGGEVTASTGDDVFCGLTTMCF